MASYKSDDSDDSIRVYTTDTIVDNPGAEIVYKGLVICASNSLHIQTKGAYTYDVRKIVRPPSIWSAFIT